MGTKMKLLHPHFSAAIFVGALAGVLTFALTPLLPVWSGEQVEPPPLQPSPTPVTATPTPTPVPSPEPERTPPGEPTPSTPAPSPSPGPRAAFPPSLPECTTGDPERLNEEAFTALDSENQARAEELFEALAACGGEYALAVGTMYDPAQTVSGNRLVPNPRKALRFYAYAAALGKRAEVLQRLPGLSDAVRGNPDLEREIDGLLEALSRS